MVVLGSLAFAVTAAALHRIRWRTAAVLSALCIIPPPFFWPAFGVLALTVYRLARPIPQPAESKQPEAA